MRYILWCILVSFFVVAKPVSAKTATAITDSLIAITQTNTDTKILVMTYRNLADLYFEQPDELNYLKKLYTTAKAAEDKETILETLNDITFSYIKSCQADSVLHYMNMLHSSGTFQETVPYLSYLRMRLFEYRTRKNEGVAAINEELKFLNEPGIDKDNIYIQIEKAYTTGCGLYVNEQYQEANAYLEVAYNLSVKLPLQNASIKSLITWGYANSFNNINQVKRFTELVEEVYQLYKSSYEQFYATDRPFYNISIRYLQCYAAIFMRINILSDKKINFYMKLIEELKDKLTDAIDQYNYYLAKNNYYLYKKDYKKALATNDSLIKYAHIVGPNNIPGLYEISSQVYEAIGDYKEAYNYHKLYSRTKDSIASAAFQTQLNELQVKYDVDTLNYKNTQLENKNRYILLITLCVILILFIGICSYLYYDLKKERKMKQELSILNKKAEESEKMKTAFINSMCHEIRTPLNAIVGFSGLMIDESIDYDSKKDFYNLITTNTQVLTSLIDHLLVVANLDSSEELLPTERTNIKEICTQEMTKIKGEAKPDIAYLLDFPKEEIFIATDEKYLSLVIENLLNNANKFTEKGSITLKVWIDKAQGKLRIDVIDTGCGIPEDKREFIFRRFTKLNDFTQGNGLGLYLSRLIIKRLAGEIFLNTHYKEGAWFTIYLPI